MPLAFEQKEDLRLRVADLEQKLEESEEERIKLEKTCNMLVRAFREEEKMHYKALNNKYEKFLEDCKVRRRRNDIILKSLCRVEDRAKALYARTERLKLLKDRYISYLKPNNSERPVRTYSDPKIIHSRLETSRFDKTGPKSVSWKSPQVAELLNYSPRDSIHNTEYESFRQNIPDPFSDASSKSRSQRENILDKILLKETLKVKDRISLPSSNIESYLDSYSVLKKGSFEPSLSSSIQDVQSPRKINICEDKSYQSERDLNKPSLDKPGINFTSRLNELDHNLSTQLDSKKVLTSPDSDALMHKTSEEGVKSNTEDLKSSFPKRTSEPINGFALRELSPEKKQKDVVVNYQSHKDKEKLQPNPEELKVDSNIKANDGRSELMNLPELALLKEKGFVKHQECIENLKTALLKEEQGKKSKSEEGVYLNNDKMEPKIIEKDEIEISEKVVIRQSDGSVGKNAEGDEGHSIAFNPAEENFQERVSEVTERKEKEDEFPFPKGLDGIDYEDETYPESYYEQPVRHRNYSDIVTNVILEEDESEQENDEPENDSKHSDKDIVENDVDKANQQLVFNSNYSRHSLSSPSVSEASKSQKSDKHDPCSDRSFEAKITEAESMPGKNIDLIEHSQETSDKAAMDENAAVALESNKARPKGLIQSNLMHLLESDSESFQMEHGDLVSGNEDSDFDFSFH